MRGLRTSLALVALLASGAVVACDVPAPSSPVPFPLLTGKAGPVTARVSVSQFRDLGADVEAAAYAAAKDIKAGAALLHGGNIGVHGVYRKGVAVRLAPATAQYPESAAAVDARSANELYGPVVGGALAHGNAVLSKTSAALFGAKAGDVLAVWTWTNRRLAYIGIDAVVDDAQVPAELTMSTVSAGRIGFYRPSSVQLYGYKSDAAIDAALKAHGLPRVDARVSHGGGGPTPDSTLDLATTKAELGQFWYISNADGTVTVDPVWRQANVIHTSFTGIPITAWCHKKVVPAIQGALTEIAASGLAGAIDVANTNRYGGCFGPREVRAAGGTTGGILSRHTWAMAIDMNTATNPMGGVPTMDCRVVRIFRKWGFAWGGNFTTPDGMHFEWVGQDRSQISYPSRYCPNIIPPQPAGAAAVTAATAAAAGSSDPPRPPSPTTDAVSLQVETQGDE